MKRALIVVLLLFPSTSVFAQYGPPARDLRDAVRMLQEVQRLIEPAIAAVRDDTAVLAALAKAEKQMKDAQPMTSFDDAEKTINEFLEHRNAMPEPMSKELERTIAEAQRVLRDGRSLMNVRMTREKLHHEVVHPLQRQVLRNVDQLQGVTQQLQFMQSQFTTRVIAEALNAATYASTDER